MRKGILEYCILAIISRGETYASDIISELRDAKLMVVEGTLYPLLTRLKNNNLLVYNWIESVSGPPRKYFRLSEEGEQVLAQLHETWRDLAFAVQKATEHSRANPSGGMPAAMAGPPAAAAGPPPGAPEPGTIVGSVTPAAATPAPSPDHDISNDSSAT